MTDTGRDKKMPQKAEQQHCRTVWPYIIGESHAHARCLVGHSVCDTDGYVMGSCLTLHSDLRDEFDRTEVAGGSARAVGRLLDVVELEDVTTNG